VQIQTSTPDLHKKIKKANHLAFAWRDSKWSALFCEAK